MKQSSPRKLALSVLEIWRYILVESDLFIFFLHKPPALYPGFLPHIEVARDYGETSLRLQGLVMHAL